LKTYDYSQAGAYFVTLCAQGKDCLFGEITDGEMKLNQYGQIVRMEWERSGEIRPTVEIDAFVIMPKHFHGIIVIGRGTLQRAPTTQHVQTIERFGCPTSNSIPTIVRLFKSTTTKQINEIRGTPRMPVWQRNYYERVIRNEKESNEIRRYIVDNPLKWAEDKNYI
jgi:putative transposase